MKTKNPDYKAVVEHIFADAPFVSIVGVRLQSIAIGKCEAILDLTPRHRQHMGRIHGAVLTTLAGHTAAGAAMSIVPADQIVVAVEFKMNILRDIKGDTLVSRAQILKPGTSLITTESEIYDGEYSPEKLVSKSIFTFMAVNSDTLQPPRNE